MSDIVEICVQVYAFQKRFWWMMSSIYQQSGGLDDIIVKINTHKDDKYNYLTDRLISVFSDKLNIKHKIYDDDNFNYRGYTRTNDIKEADGDWLFFTDADMLFHPKFFSDLKTYYKGWKNQGYCYTSPRWNVDKARGYEIVDSVGYEDVIKNSFDICWKDRIGYSGNGRAPGAGYFQLVETEYLKNNNILKYVDNDRSDRPINHRIGNKTFSDRRFRGKMNGVKCLKKKKDSNGSIDVLYPIIHLNHYRKREKEYIEVCR